ncbi:MAG: DinB family protein [Pirellulales bacterium]|nr:DinB family protein [Pirellulales bacterium]
MATVKDVLRQGVEFGNMLVEAYLGDLTDQDLLVRSVPGSNHIAWQLGHIICGTRHMLRELGREAPELPPEFTAAYTKETSSIDDPAKFATKEEYLRRLAEMKAAMLAAIDQTPEETLDQPGPESMQEYAPTVSAALIVLSNHWMMHAGQFVPIRRKLGKPPLF